MKLSKQTFEVSAYLEAKLRGIQCHMTQMVRDSPYAEAPDEVMREPWFRRESFVLARSTVGWPQGVETDLFARLR
jgi:LmbE family N-acetylglucosaminyl deacetylase